MFYVHGLEIYEGIDHFLKLPHHHISHCFFVMRLVILQTKSIWHSLKLLKTKGHYVILVSQMNDENSIKMVGRR